MRWDGPARDKLQHRSVGVLHNELRKSRVLLVGAGGIGCELLKDLVKSGFGEVHIIDLDTIDLSNLNRQFLFRHEHIKKPKALVAKDVAQQFDPRCKIIAHHANIKDEQYSVEWFSSFRIVFNALDNIDARRHVNQMCLAADVPLIESGTTGFSGNVQVIKKGKTACYDCKEKQVPKSYPVCTVRSTPSQPIHTIVWAKSYLLPELFGVSEDETSDMDNTVDSDNAEEIKKLKQESEELRKLKESIGSPEFAQKVFDKAYKQDIDRLLSMDDFWKEKKPPQPLQHSVLATDAAQIRPSIAETDQRPWSLAENFAVFNDSVDRLSKRLLAERATAEKIGAQPPIIEFDKDDNDTLDFVTAAANLRSAAFHIDTKSKFETKQMAGNIIPAIATTNAMTAALCIFQAYKVMRNEVGRTKEIFLQRANMVGDVSDSPNPECPVCTRAMARVQIDLEKATLKDIIGVLKSDFGYGSDFNINLGSLIIYDYLDAEDDEDAAAKRLASKLSDLDVKYGSVLTIHDDEGDEPRVDLMLFVEKNLEAAEALVKIVHKGEDKLVIPRKPTKPQTNGIDPEPSTPATSVLKRKRNLDDDGVDQATPVKKISKSKEVDGVISLDDDDEEKNGQEEEGAIVLE